MSWSPSMVPAREDRKVDGEDQFEAGEIMVNADSDPEETFSKKQIAEAVQACLDELPTTERLVLKSRILEDLKLRELSEMMDCSLENVRLIQKRAQELMKICLERRAGL